MMKHGYFETENGAEMTDQMPSMTLEEAKIKFANCWHTMMSFTVPSDYSSVQGVGTLGCREYPRPSNARSANTN